MNRALKSTANMHHDPAPMPPKLLPETESRFCMSCPRCTNPKKDHRSKAPRRGTRTLPYPDEGGAAAVAAAAAAAAECEKFVSVLQTHPLSISLFPTGVFQGAQDRRLQKGDAKPHRKDCLPRAVTLNVTCDITLRYGTVRYDVSSDFYRTSESSFIGLSVIRCIIRCIIPPKCVTALFYTRSDPLKES